MLNLNKGRCGNEGGGEDNEGVGLTAPASTHPPPSSLPTTDSTHPRDADENSESDTGNVAGRAEGETAAPTRRSGHPARGRKFQLTKACRCNEVVTEVEKTDPSGTVTRCNKDGCESVWVTSANTKTATRIRLRLPGLLKLR
jgi:hypothetical protein